MPPCGAAVGAQSRGDGRGAAGGGTAVATGAAAVWAGSHADGRQADRNAGAGRPQPSSGWARGWRLQRLSARVQDHAGRRRPAPAVGTTPGGPATSVPFSRVAVGDWGMVAAAWEGGGICTGAFGFPVVGLAGGNVAVPACGVTNRRDTRCYRRRCARDPWPGVGIEQRRDDCRCGRRRGGCCACPGP